MLKLPLFSVFPNDSTGGAPCLMDVVESAVGGYLRGSLLHHCWIKEVVESSG